MLYKKNSEKQLSDELFQNPTAEYRGAPFWSWNCELDKDDLLWQIEQLKKMGFGGFHMHTRAGMATPYLSKEFMDLINACTQKAKDTQMLSWLYDEDRWPSGAAGGFVTKEPRFRQRMLVFTQEKRESVSKETALETGTDYLLATYDIVLNNAGELERYRLISENENAVGDKWYAYIAASPKTGWYNGQTYVDTLNKRAIDRFIEITHEAYKQAVGEEFGDTIPAIFTDEPQFTCKTTLKFAKDHDEIKMTWTPDFDETYQNAYHINIVEKLPELIWELPGGKVSAVRYYYHDHVCERFTEAFSNNCGTWCIKNGLYLTGHMLCEESLYAQTRVVGEVIRAYRSFGLPGIDILCNNHEYNTAKQAQSAVHQYGREGMMSELFGVTNWDFDFRGHKAQGDWQAALGVTIHVPHLSWVSMKGSAKRDYPASINYQSPWYQEYPYIEDHFARIHTALTRGTPEVSVGVIHPIESYWLHWGPAENTNDVRMQMDDNFEKLTEWLLFGTVDFDFISESCLPDLCGEIGKTLTVGKMKYSTILVSGCETLRQTTVDILNSFIDQGGRVIFIGSAPKYIDAIENPAAKALYRRANAIPFEKTSIMNALACERVIDVKNRNGAAAESLIYNLRRDGGNFWLFFANARPQSEKQELRISIKGSFKPVLYDTMTGEIRQIEYKAQEGMTYIEKTFYENDSLLLKLMPAAEEKLTLKKPKDVVVDTINFKGKVDYRREEENVCLLDLAEYSFNGGEFQPLEEVLRIDEHLRGQLGWTKADGQDTQPWAIEKEEITNFVTLRFPIICADNISAPYFCAEELAALNVNGRAIPLEKCGWYVDKSIIKYPLPDLPAGKNVLEAKIPFGRRISIESCYLTGSFDVKLDGCCAVLSKPSEQIAFGSIVSQGMPFYGGNIRYITKITTPACTLAINTAKYKGSLVRVFLDGQDMGVIAFAPYNLKINDVSAGEHTIEFKLFGNRHNTFGSLHNCGNNKWFGPDHWYSTGDDWCYEYNTKPTGILKSPVISILSVND